jgi:hypothetical protein
MIFINLCHQGLWKKELQNKVIQEKKPVSSTEKVDPREMQQLYQQMLQEKDLKLISIS